MAHNRTRLIENRLRQLSRLWPVVGVLGARQSGKTTLLTTQLKIGASVSFDDEDLRSEAKASGKIFLEKQGTPLLIDEVQKVPSIFDAIKLKVDKKRLPGTYFLTGSTEFSSKVGIQESLTGRIGLIQLFPLNLAESAGKMLPTWKKPIGHREVRFSPSDLAKYSLRGGMPVPMFLRDQSQVESYWQGWLETTVHRDLYRVYGRGYRPEISMQILREFGTTLSQGDLATLNRFSLPGRTLNKYLGAMETIFLIRRIAMHPKGIGSDAWILLDSGLARYLMKTHSGMGPSLSLVRHAVWNELLSLYEYRLRPFRPFYYKSAKGAPVDWIDEENKVAFKIIIEGRGSSYSYHERSLGGAMKTLGLTTGFLVSPVEKPDLPKKSGIGLLPWTYWS